MKQKNNLGLWLTSQAGAFKGEVREEKKIIKEAVEEDENKADVWISDLRKDAKLKKKAHTL